MRNVRYLGLDVHAETIAVAIAEPNGEVRSVGVIANRPEAVRRLVKKLGAPEQLRACYEAGPTGYALHRAVEAAGLRVEVIAPSKTPNGRGTPPSFRQAQAIGAPCR